MPIPDPPRVANRVHPNDFTPEWRQAHRRANPIPVTVHVEWTDGSKADYPGMLLSWAETGTGPDRRMVAGYVSYYPTVGAGGPMWHYAQDIQRDN